MPHKVCLYSLDGCKVIFHQPVNTSESAYCGDNRGIGLL
jgi:hypothetical protein